MLGLHTGGMQRLPAAYTALPQDVVNWQARHAVSACQKPLHIRFMCEAHLQTEVLQRLPAAFTALPMTW